MPSCSPGSVRVSTSRFHSALYRISFTSVLLPEPDAPVIATSLPSGKLTSTSLQVVLPRAAHGQHLARAFAALPGVAIERLPEKNWPVGEALQAIKSSRVPCTTTCPPWTPGPGPISTM